MFWGVLAAAIAFAALCAGVYALGWVLSGLLEEDHGLDEHDGEFLR